MPAVQRLTRISSQAPVAYERHPGAAAALPPGCGHLLSPRVIEALVRAFVTGARAQAELSLEGAQGELVDMESSGDVKDAATDGAEQGFDVEVRGWREGDEQER